MLPPPLTLNVDVIRPGPPFAEQLRRRLPVLLYYYGLSNRRSLLQLFQLCNGNVILEIYSSAAGVLILYDDDEIPRLIPKRTGQREL